MSTLGNRKYTHGSKVPCPICGEPKDRRSKTCRACWLEGKERGPQDECPGCGGKKRVSSDLCYTCSHSRPEPTPKKGIRKTSEVFEMPDREWMLQFVGFFLADGCITVNHSGRYRSPRISINLRADEEPWLKDIQSKLGGRLTTYDPQTDVNSNLQCRWDVSGFTATYPIISAILDLCSIKPKKVLELEIAKEWCEWRMSWPNRLGDDGYKISIDYANKLSEAKDFKVLG